MSDQSKVTVTNGSGWAFVALMCLCAASCGTPDIIDSLQCRLWAPHCVTGEK